MGYGIINVWIREPNDCSVSEMRGIAWARPCCNTEELYQKPLENGHAELEVPPGCYIVDAGWPPGCCGRAKETVVIVRCNETVCVNLIREYAGDPYASLVPLMTHAEEANIPKEEIDKFVGILEKIGKTVPPNKLKRYTKKELDILEKVSDTKHKEKLKKYRHLFLRGNE